MVRLFYFFLSFFFQTSCTQGAASQAGSQVWWSDLVKHNWIEFGLWANCELRWSGFDLFFLGSFHSRKEERKKEGIVEEVVMSGRLLLLYLSVFLSNTAEFQPQ